MNGYDVVAQYLGSCISGTIAMSDCGPVWQIGVIALLISAAVTALLVLRVKAGRKPGAERR